MWFSGCGLEVSSDWSRCVAMFLGVRWLGWVGVGVEMALDGRGVSK